MLRSAFLAISVLHGWIAVATPLTGFNRVWVMIVQSSTVTMTSMSKLVCTFESFLVYFVTVFMAMLCQCDALNLYSSVVCGAILESIQKKRFKKQIAASLIGSTVSTCTYSN